MVPAEPLCWVRLRQLVPIPSLPALLKSFKGLKRAPKTLFPAARQAGVWYITVGLEPWGWFFLICSSPAGGWHRSCVSWLTPHHRLEAALLLVTDGWDAPRVVGAVQKAFRGVKSMAEM